jgi:hypothetical protein
VGWIRIGKEVKNSGKRMEGGITGNPPLKDAWGYGDIT